MGRKQVEAIARAHGAHIEKGALQSVEPEEVKDEITGTLKDPKIQDKILHPDEKKITLEGDEEITLHKPSIQAGRRIYGFATRVLADAAQMTPPSRPDLIPVRAASILCSRGDLERELLVHVCKLRGKTGQVTDDRAEDLADELGERVSQSDIALLFAELSLIAGIGAQDPKKSPSPRRRRT